MATEPAFTVVSTMKNEGPYILEWVAHQKALGFKDIVVCTNDCDDNTTEILKRLEHLGHVHHHATRVGRAGIHRSALRQASRMDVVRNADWIFVCDVDEFLNIKVGDGTVQTLVELSGTEADVISIPWKIYGSSNISLFRDRLVTKQFVETEAPGENPDRGKFVKSIFREPARFKRMGLHHPVPHEGDDPHTVLPGGARFLREGARTETPAHFEIAQVNHYALRTLDSFLIKRDRGRANHMHHVIGLDYWHRFDFNGMRDDSIFRYAERTEQIRAELREDEALAFMHRKAVRWHNWKARELRREIEMRELRLQVQNLMAADIAKRAAAEEAEANARETA